MAAAALTDILLARADTTPDSVAYETLGPGGAVQALSYAQVAARACQSQQQLKFVTEPVA